MAEGLRTTRGFAVPTFIDQSSDKVRVRDRVRVRVRVITSHRGVSGMHHIAKTNTAAEGTAPTASMKRQPMKFSPDGVATGLGLV